MQQQSDVGLIVFISSGPRGRGDLVFVDWVKRGEELELLDNVQRFATDKLWVLATASATKRDVARFLRAHKSGRHQGNWFKFTPAVMRGLVGEIKRERVELRTTREFRQAA